MKRLFLVLTLLLAGCATASIPNYLQDDNPYVRTFYVGHDQALKAVQLALKELGWKINKTMDPLVYEQKNEGALNKDEVLLISDIRQTPMFLGTRYSKINVYVRSQNNSTQVELRYFTVTSTFIKNFYSYKHDRAANKIFAHIEGLINNTK